MKLGKLSNKIDWESEEYDEFLEEQVIASQKSASQQTKLRKSFRRYAEGNLGKTPDEGRDTGIFVR